MRCDQCKWWGNGDVPIVGSATKKERKHCGLYVYDNRDWSGDVASVLEDGDYASSEASLWTKPDFFCARFRVL